MSPKLKNFLELTAIYGILLVMGVIIAYPLLWALGLSLNEGTNMYMTTMIPDPISFEHYQWLFFGERSNYVQWYINSLIVATFTSIFSTAFAAVVAYAFSRYRFVGRTYGLYAFLLLQMFPVFMGMVAFFIMLNMVNLLDTLTGLIIIYVAGSIPFMAWLVKGYYDTIPRELDEAARIDGAGHFRVFFTIMLPLAKPILAVVALFQFMAPMFDFILPRIILRSPDNFTLALGLFNFVNNQFANNFTRFAAGAMLVAIPIAVIYLYLQRYLITGLTAGGTKG